MAGLYVVEWQCGGVIRLAVTGVHTAAAVASLMGFNPTQRHHHNGTVNPLRWETSHTSALINTHGCRCNGAHTHTHMQPASSLIYQQFLRRTTISFFPVPLPFCGVWTIVIGTSLCVLLFYRWKKWRCGIWNIKTDNLTDRILSTEFVCFFLTRRLNVKHMITSLVFVSSLAPWPNGQFTTFGHQQHP